MLGTFLDLADAQGRDRLTATEKAAMVTGGLSARLEAVVPRQVQRAAAAVLVGLLGAFAVFTGVFFEWMPWGGPARSVVVAQVEGAGGHAFGQFLSPFVVIAFIAAATVLASLLASDCLYRWLLGACVAACAVVTVLAHYGVGGFRFLRAAPCVFVGVIAMLALLTARPRRVGVMISAAAWLAAFCVSPAVFGPVPVWHLLSGYPYGTATFFDTVVQPALAYFGSLLALLTAVALMAVRRAGIAAIVVIVSIPFAVLSCIHGWSGRDPIYVLVLAAAFASAAITAVGRASRRATGTNGHPEPLAE